MFYLIQSILGYTHLKDRLPGVPENSQTDGVTLTIYGPDKSEKFKKLTLEGKTKFALTAQEGSKKLYYIINILELIHRFYFNFNYDYYY